MAEIRTFNCSLDAVVALPQVIKDAGFIFETLDSRCESAHRPFNFDGKLCTFARACVTRGSSRVTLAVGLGSFPLRNPDDEMAHIALGVRRSWLMPSKRTDETHLADDIEHLLIHSRVGHIESW